MRAVIINPCHPDTTHVCGLRARSFANAMAARGHDIILLTPPLEETDGGQALLSIGDSLASHGWQEPFRLVAPYQHGSLLPKLRHGDFPGGFRQALIGLNYARYGSVYEDWCKGARAYFPAVRDSFRPDIVWAIFGHTGCWRAGQELAALASCPWVMDVKDSWTAFIPSLFRRMLARRFGDAAHITALSEAHAALIHRWIPARQKSVIYSGMPATFVSRRDAELPPEKTSKSIFLCGSIYDAAHLETIFSALDRWLNTNDNDGALPVRLIYAGADTEIFLSAAKKLSKRCAVETFGHVPLDRLHAEMKAASLNLHLYFPRVLFHHKLFELIAADRPILSFPGESEEAQNIADEIGAQLYRCSTNEQLLAAFDSVLGGVSDTGPGVSAEKLSRYSWDGQAESLEKVFQTVTQKT